MNGKVYFIEGNDLISIRTKFDNGASYNTLVDFLVRKGYSEEAAQVIVSDFIDSAYDSALGDIDNYR